MYDSSFDPPNSRLFILCGKSTSEDELRNTFDKYGTIEDVWVVKDKSTGDSKGVVYIKFSKASEAALAMEEQNGKCIGNLGKPIKIMIAHSREQGSKKDDDPERLLRLFIVIPRTMTEEEIRDHFKEFGDIDSISIVRNRETGESKGVAYVKFYKAYHAAKALEECSKSFKAVFARPKEQKPSYQSFDSGDRDHRGGGHMYTQRYDDVSRSSNGIAWPAVRSSTLTDNRLTAFVSRSVSEDLIYKLFDIVPGLEAFRTVQDPGLSRSPYYGMQKVYIEYSCPEAASHALEKLDGFEYPPGQRIVVKSYLGESGLLKSPSQIGTASEGMTAISKSELTTLTKALAKAESIIKAAGLGAGVGVPNQSGDGGSFDPSYCSAKLPPPQPMVKGSPDGPTHRLFIVCQPGLPPVYALRDVFGRFGGLVEVYMLNGKNCGYVTYTTKESAETAIETLHCQELCGMKLKVLKAEPPRFGPQERKRSRLDDSDN